MGRRLERIRFRFAEWSVGGCIPDCNVPVIEEQPNLEGQLGRAGEMTTSQSTPGSQNISGYFSDLQMLEIPGLKPGTGFILQRGRPGLKSLRNGRIMGK
jgi:hypothetical protein